VPDVWDYELGTRLPPRRLIVTYHSRHFCAVTTAEQHRDEECAEVACLATSIGMFIFLMFSNNFYVGRGQPCPDEVCYLLEVVERKQE